MWERFGWAGCMCVGAVEVNLFPVLVKSLKNSLQKCRKKGNFLQARGLKCKVKRLFDVAD